VIEAGFAILAGLFFATAVYLMLAQSLIRVLLGIVTLGNGVNLLIFTAGRIGRDAPPVIAEGFTAPSVAVANPLPQALILTAIVISFSLFAFILVLAFRGYEMLGTDDVSDMRHSEPRAKLPPLGN
jgi:multicomponent Na+:H+ antiporter subunit C